MPNLWSATHMTFNYTQGFIRRGLFGQVLRALGGRNIYHYNKLALIAVVMFVLAVLAMARLTRRMLATDGGDRGLVAATLVFAASPGIVFLAHEIGYLDYVGFIAVPLFIVWGCARPHAALADLLRRDRAQRRAGADPRVDDHHVRADDVAGPGQPRDRADPRAHAVAPHAVGAGRARGRGGAGRAGRLVGDRYRSAPRAPSASTRCRRRSSATPTSRCAATGSRRSTVRCATTCCTSCPGSGATPTTSAT